MKKLIKSASRKGIVASKKPIKANDELVARQEVTDLLYADVYTRVTELLQDIGADYPAQYVASQCPNYDMSGILDKAGDNSEALADYITQIIIDDYM